MNVSDKIIRPVVYQLLPRLFGNLNPNRVKGSSIEENGCGKFDDIKRKALEEIKNMGVTHVWYTGVIEHALLTDYSKYGISVDYADVVKGRAGSPYAIKDYYDVDPDLANSIPDRLKEFDSLVQRTHDAGLKVMIDFVPNHLARQYVSDQNPAGINDFGSADDCSKAFSPGNNYYYLPGRRFVSPVSSGAEDGWRENPARATGNDCFSAAPSVNDWYETVKLNYGIDYETGKTHFDPIPDTWLKMRDVILYWASRQIDAFRCDMAGMVPVEFWQWLFAEVEKQYPDLLFIAEIYEPHRYHDYLHKAGFDFLYDKEVFYNTMRDVITRQRPASDLTDCWTSVGDLQSRLLYYLENHDEQRIASRFFSDDPFVAIPGMVAMATISRNPLLIYFGQELGEPGMDEEGFSTMDGRTSIFDYWAMPLYQQWINNGKFDGSVLPERNLQLRRFYSELLNLVNREPALREGKFFDLTSCNENNPAFDGGSVYAFFRYCGEQLLLVLINFSNDSVDYRLHVPRHFFELAELDDRCYFTGNDKLNINKTIQFSAAVALNLGLGGTLKPRSASVYELHYSR